MTDLTARYHDREILTVSHGIKRAMDILGAVLGLVLTSPVFLLLMMLMTFAGAPLFFRQRRIGRGGVVFDCLKFRTMAVDAEASISAVLGADRNAADHWAQRQKLRHDPRITPLGRHLRRWGIDELPQLINVLRGEMSLVGPRPVITPDNRGYPADRAYADSLAFQAYLRVRPGITGLWQVRGGADLPYRHRVSLDQRYVRSWSLGLDIWILAVTPLALLRRKSF
ncbi:MAG: sugar transferase [Pseudomonadota bacterium]